MACDFRQARVWRDEFPNLGPSPAILADLLKCFIEASVRREGFPVTPPLAPRVYAKPPATPSPEPLRPGFEPPAKSHIPNATTKTEKQKRLVAARFTPQQGANASNDHRSISLQISTSPKYPLLRDFGNMTNALVIGRDSLLWRGATPRTA